MSDALENLLQNPRVWRGHRRAGDREPEGLATGYAVLDRHLPGGGWPRHALTEILLQDHGTGELELLMPALARLSNPERGCDDGETGWIAWIAPPFQPYPPALLQWGLSLSRILVMHPRRGNEALWAAEQALSSGNCAAVLLWLDAMNDTAGRRLQLAAETGGSWAVAFRPLAALSQSSAAALRIELVAGERGTDIRILKSRGGRPVRIPGLINAHVG